MKIEECDVVQDLLPSYSDKLLSETSKKLVEEHLKKCKNCSEVLKNMNKEIDTSTLFNQDEQIDYLKGYRRKKILTVICAVIITILILIEGFIVTTNILTSRFYYIDVNDVKVEGWQTDEVVGFFLNNEKYTVLFEDRYTKQEDENNQSLYLKLVGGYQFPWEKIGDTMYTFGIDERLNKIYIEDKEGKVKEIWNRDTGLQVEDISYRVGDRYSDHYNTLDGINKMNAEKVNK